MPDVTRWDLVIVAPAWDRAVERLVAEGGESRVLLISGDDLEGCLPSNVQHGYVPVHNLTWREVRRAGRLRAKRAILVLRRPFAGHFARMEMLFWRIRSRRKRRGSCAYSPWPLFLGLLGKPLRLAAKTGVQVARYLALATWPLWFLLRLPRTAWAGCNPFRGAVHSAFFRGLWRWRPRNSSKTSVFLGQVGDVLRYVQSYVWNVERIVKPSGCDVPDAAKVLVVMPDKVGDTLTTVPLLRNLAAATKRYRIDYLAGPAGREVLRGCPWLSRMYIYDRPHPELDYWTTTDSAGTRHRTLLKRLRANRYDLVVNCSYWPERGALIDRVRASVCLSRPCRGLLVYGCEETPARAPSVYQQTVDVLGAISESTELRGTRLWVGEAERRRVSEALGVDPARDRLVGIHSHAPLPARRLPPSRLMRLVREREDLGAATCIVFDKPDLRWRLQPLSGMDVRFVGDRPLRDAVVAASLLDVLYAVEGGIGHLACASGVESHLVFTTFLSGRWCPPGGEPLEVDGLACRPCRRPFCRYRHECHRVETAAAGPVDAPADPVDAPADP